MRLLERFFIFAVVAFAIIGTAFASAQPAADTSYDNSTYFAPLIEPCLPKDRNCGVMNGSYIVALRPGYTPSSHLSYLAEHIDVDPVKDWQMQWAFEFYSIKNVSAHALNIIRRDPGIEEVEQGYWFSAPMLDLCRNPRLSDEERRICYEEEDLRDCEKPSLSKEDRQSCYGFEKYLSCMGPGESSEDEERNCRAASLAQPCNSLHHSEEEQRFCRDGSLFATSTNLQLSIFEEGRRTCAGKPKTDKTKATMGEELDGLDLIDHGSL